VVPYHSPSAPATPAAAPLAATTARIGGTFGPEDRARVSEIAVRNRLPVPGYDIAAVGEEVAARHRKFVGVWASSIGYNNGLGRQAMIIATSVSKDGVLRGFVVGGPPTPQSNNQAPAFAVPFTARIGGNRFSFFAQNIVRRIDMAVDGQLRMTDAGMFGTFTVALAPVWMAADPAAGSESETSAPASAAADAGHPFDQAARARVDAIGVRHKLPMPEYGFDLPGDTPDRFRKLIGVWASSTGFNGGPVQGMLIVTRVGEAGDADGYYVFSGVPSSSKTFPAKNIPLVGLIIDNKLSFVALRSVVNGTWTARNTVQMRVALPRGDVVTTDFQPVWTLTTGLQAEMAPATRSPARPAATRNLLKRSPPPAVATSEISPPTAGPGGGGPGRGGRGGGGGRGDVMNSPRFPMCARMASQRGLMGPTPERRQFVRSCVLNG
jgi:hypothetical protein